MKVGVDGVLLGAWANPCDATTILDIGTGTGLLSLMLAQKCEVKIHAIEVESNSFQQAKLNFEQSLWINRMTIEQISFQDFCLKNKSFFDLIVCNPPYFVNSLKSPKANRNTARHNDTLILQDLFQGVSKLLSENGSFALIYPFDQKDSLIKEASENKLYANRELIVRGTEKKEPNRILVEYSRQKKDYLSTELIIRNHLNNDYTAAYKELTKDYYLAF